MLRQTKALTSIARNRGFKRDLLFPAALPLISHIPALWSRALGGLSALTTPVAPRL